MNELNKKEMKIVEKKQMTHNTFFMRLQTDKEVLSMRVAYHILIYDDKGSYKPYSPLYITNDSIAFAIKVYPTGKISNFVNSKEINDTLTVSELIPTREIKLNEFKNVLLIAGGTGVTPIYQMLYNHIQSGMNTTDFTLLFLNKTPEDVFLQNELEILKKKSNGKLQIIHIFSQGTDKPDSTHVSGKLIKDMLLTVTKSKMFEFVFLCGPPGLYDSFSGRKVSRTEQGELKGILKELGYTEKNVWKF